MEVLIKKIKEVLDQKGTVEEIRKVLLYNNTDWNRTNQRLLESTIKSCRNMEVNEISAAIIIYIYLRGDEAIEFSRKRGVFAYYSDPSVAERVLLNLLTYIDGFNVSEDNREYLYHKYELKWLHKYYIECDDEIDTIIHNHERKKKIFHVNGGALESNLVIELLTLLELLFRFKRQEIHIRTSATIEFTRELDYDVLDYYSLEEIAEAISFIISRYCDKYKCKDTYLWLDVNSVLKDIELVNLIQIAAKRKLIAEWEITIDYFGYDIEKINDSHYIIIDKCDLEKSMQLGYLKTSIQEQARYYHIYDSLEDSTLLRQLAEFFREDSQLILELVDKDTEIERYRMKFPIPLLETIAQKDHDKTGFYMEEVGQINDAAHEMLLSAEEIMDYRITETCTVKDVILFKRIFTFVSYMKQFLLENHKGNMETVARSIVPSFKKTELMQLVSVFVDGNKKAKDLVELYTWEGKGILDIQSTPIIKLNNNQYVLVPYVLATSNLIRNVIQKERKSESQWTNSDGSDEPLERITKLLFDSRGDVFGHRERCRFKYKQDLGEIDLVVWSNQHLYLIECKNSILPTSSFELRTTYDYIKKAEKQLDLSSLAMKDDIERKQILNNWRIPVRDYNIHTLIVLGNRIFAAPNGFRHSIRHFYELEMILTTGIIRSSFGEWRYWKEASFSEDDFIRFISDNDFFENDFLEAMSPYKMIVSAGDNTIEKESYSLNMLKYYELNDKNLVNLSNEEHMARRVDYEKMHNETLEYLKKDV